MPKRNKTRNARPRKRRGPGPTLPSGNTSNTFKVEAKRQGSLITTPRRMLGFFPDRVRTVLRYSEKRTFTATSGVPGLYQFAGNSAYDPNYTGTGSQPANYDDLMVHYNRYRVYGSHFQIVATASASVMDVVVWPSNSTSGPLVPDDTAQPYSVFTSVGSNSAVLGNSATSLKIVGRNPATTDALSALYNADPADLWLWNITYNGYDQSTTATIQTLVVIDYDVEVFDRNWGGLDAIEKRLTELKVARASRKPRFPQSASDLKTLSLERAVPDHKKAETLPTTESDYALIDIEDLPRTAGGNTLTLRRRKVASPATFPMSSTRPP